MEGSVRRPAECRGIHIDAELLLRMNGQFRVPLEAQLTGVCWGNCYGMEDAWGFFGLEVHLDPALEANDWVTRDCSVVGEKAWPGLPSNEDFERSQGRQRSYAAAPEILVEGEDTAVVQDHGAKKVKSAICPYKILGPKNLQRQRQRWTIKILLDHHEKNWLNSGMGDLEDQSSPLMGE